jgi:hypothetical protein
VGCLPNQVKLTRVLYKELDEAMGCLPDQVKLDDHGEEASQRITELESLCKQHQEVVEKLKKENVTLESIVQSHDELILEIAIETGLDRMGEDEDEDDSEEDDDDDGENAAAPPAAMLPAAATPELVLDGHASTDAECSALSPPPPPRDRLGDFQCTKPPTLSHTVDLMDAEDWLKSVEMKLQVVQCNNCEVLLASHQLSGPIANWWDAYMKAHEEPESINRREFRAAFRAHHVPQGVIKLKKMEFQDLKQGSLSVNEYVTKFTQLSCYVLNEEQTAIAPKGHLRHPHGKRTRGASRTSGQRPPSTSS